MNTEARVRAYGGDPHRLTPAQRRRAAHKDRRANRRPAAFCITRLFPGGSDAACLDDRMLSAYGL